MSEMIDFEERARQLGIRAGARLVHHPVSVFKELDITFTREEWAEMNAAARSDYPYPFADVVNFPAPPNPITESKDE